MKGTPVIVLAVILTLSLSLTSVTFATGGETEVVLAQMVLDASLSEVSTAFDIPKENLEVAESRAFTFEADGFLLSSIVDKSSRQAYMVSTDAQGKVWIAKPKIQDELLAYMSQMKSNETVIINIWAIYVSPEEELQQIPSKYPDVPFEGYCPALGANISLEILDAIRADITEIKLRANQAAVQPVVDFLQSAGSEIIYVSLLAPTVDAALSKEDVYKLARLPEVKRISLPSEEAEPCMYSAARTINANDVWQKGCDGGMSDGSGGVPPYYVQTRVAVVDKGIDFRHPSLAHANGGKYQSGYSDHGTQVAGCIASKHATYRGIAYGTKLLDAKFSTWTSLKSACEWAYFESAHVYCHSYGWGIYDYQGLWDNEYCEYFDHIASVWDVLPVCCAGNAYLGDTASEYVASPAIAFNVLAVGGIDDNNTESWADDRFWLETLPDGTVSGGSSWRNPTDGLREKPEVCAPAKAITTTKPGTTNSFITKSGTSYAAPQVAGIAALLIEQNPGLVGLPYLSKAIIMATAIHNVEPNTWPRAYDDKEGVGTVDALAAYECVKKGNYLVEYATSSRNSFDIQFYAQAGQNVRFVINWLAHTTYEGRTTYGLYTDMDFRTYSPIGTLVVGGYQCSYNPWEVCQFAAEYSGTYTVHVYPKRFDASSEWIGVAWHCW